MVLAYHVILSTYGFWLPNDPRGSWTDYLAARDLAHFGGATKVTTRRSVARVEHDIRYRLAAKQALRLPEVHLTGRQALAVGRGFARASADGQYAIHACAILPEHTHLVLGRSERRIRQVIGHLKAAASRQLDAEKLHPFADRRQAGGRLPSPWAEGGWRVYLDSAEAVVRAIRYVEQNPLKEGKPRQRWSFVVPWV